MKYLAAAVASALLFAGGASLASAQSLGEIARQEEARRKTMPVHAKVYTNESLRRDVPDPLPVYTAPAPAAGAPPAQGPPPAAGAPVAKGAPPATPAPGSPVATPGPGASSVPAVPPAPSATQTEAAWAKRVADARAGLERSRTLQDALQSRINALQADFVNRDDPAQRSQIANDRQKALAELDRVKEETLQFQKQISDIQEEARRAGVPAGVVR